MLDIRGSVAARIRVEMAREFVDECEATAPEGQAEVALVQQERPEFYRGGPDFEAVAAGGNRRRGRGDDS